MMQYSDPGTGSGTAGERVIVLLVAVLMAVLLLVIGARNYFRSPSAPSREILLEQRRRQRELIRLARLRATSDVPHPDQGHDDESSQPTRIEICAAEAEKRRRELVDGFQAKHVEMVSEKQTFHRALAPSYYLSVLYTQPLVPSPPPPPIMLLLLLLLLKTIKEEDFAVDQTILLYNDIEERKKEEQTRKDGGTARNMVLVKLPRRRPPQKGAVPNFCAICLNSYVVGEVIVWSENESCQHAFHQDCIADYLVTIEDAKKKPCPCCRQPFLIVDDLID
jgi:hypothetical protein